MTAQELRSRIMARAEEKFFQIGFSRVTMDELAEELGISKKTLYKHFESKMALVENVVRTNIGQVAECIEQIVRSEVDFMDRIRAVLSLAAGQLIRVGNTFMYDLYRNAPELWRQIDEFRSKKFVAILTSLVQEGMKQGLVHRDIDSSLIVRTYYHAFRNILSPDELANLSLTATEVLESLARIIYTGILTERGRKNFETLTIDRGEIHET